MTNTVFIYALCHPNTCEIRYVGKSKNPNRRYSEHLSKAKSMSYENIHLGNWINKLASDGLKPLLVILEECNIAEWKNREKYHISKYKNLVNMNDGGIEPPNASGRKWKLSQYEIHRSRRKGVKIWDDKPHPGLGKKSPCTGQKRSKEFCELMSQQRIENNGMRGTKRTIEQIRASAIHHMKAVSLIDDYGNILKQYESACLAQKELSLTKGSVTRVCKGEYRHTKGYRFRYAKLAHAVGIFRS